MKNQFLKIVDPLIAETPIAIGNLASKTASAVSNLPTLKGEPPAASCPSVTGALRYHNDKWGHFR